MGDSRRKCCVATCSRLLRNRIYQEPLPKPELGHPLRISACPRKQHPSSIEKSIRISFKFIVVFGVIMYKCHRIDVSFGDVLQAAEWHIG